MVQIELKQVEQFSCTGCFYRKPSVCPTEKRRECMKQARDRKYFIFVEKKTSRVKRIMNYLLNKSKVI